MERHNSNRFFSYNTTPQDEDFGTKSGVGRIDDVELLDSQSGLALITFNLIDRDWLEKNIHTIQNSKNKKSKRQDSHNNAYASAPLFHLEYRTLIHSALSHDIDAATGIFQSFWFEIEIQETRNRSSNTLLYTGLFQEPINVTIKFQATTINTSLLDNIFNLDDIPHITKSEFEHKLAHNCRASYLSVIDVGQGNSNALLAEHDLSPTLYFDIGCGVTSHKNTTPTNLEFCFQSNPIIIMSHWDKDHWAGANIQNRLGRSGLSQEWIAPRQKIDPIHIAFANEITANGGVIKILEMAHKEVGATVLKDKTSIKFTTGTGKSRNSTGIVFSVENNDSKNPLSWLLTGDCEYHYFTHLNHSPPICIVAPHHGGKLYKSTIPPSPAKNNNYRRLLYSFGHKNHFHHPNQKTILAHHTSGWDVGTWYSAAGACDATEDIRSTISHISKRSRGNILASWESIIAELPPCCKSACSISPLKN